MKETGNKNEIYFLIKLKEKEAGIDFKAPEGKFKIVGYNKFSKESQDIDDEELIKDYLEEAIATADNLAEREELEIYVFDDKAQVCYFI